jgi:O-antigen/teichoic acid export membrane protein
MQRKFVTNLAFLLFLNLLIKPFWILGIDRAVQNEVGAAEYGLYAALFNFSFLFNILLDLGITNFNNRNIARHNHLLKKHLSGILTLRIILAIGYSLFSIGIAFALGYRGGELSLLFILLLNQALLSLILYLRSNIAGLHLFRADSIVSVLDRFIMIVMCGFLLWTDHGGGSFRIEWFALTQTIAYAITAILTYLFLKTRVTEIHLSWNPKFALVILKKSYPFAILILLMTFYNRIDSVMLERLRDDGAEQAGIYAQAYRLLDAANMIAYLFSALLLPMFSHMIRHGKSPEQLTELAFSFIAVPALIVMSVGTAHADALMNLLYVHHGQEAASVFMILIHCFLSMGSVYIFGTLLTANGNLKQLNQIALGAMVLNMALNFFLIPTYGAVGAALAGLITQALAALAQMLLAHSIFAFKFRWSLAIRYLAFLATCFSVAYAGKALPQYFLIQAVLTALICIAIALILRLIRPKELLQTLRAEA